MPGFVTAAGYPEMLGLGSIELRDCHLIVNARHLFLQSSNVGNESIDVCFGQPLPKARHMASAIIDRVENTRIANVGLPLRVRQIARR